MTPTLINTSASDANVDGVDNDCNGQIDDGAQAGDQDGDGVDVFNGDCDDTDATVYPGATEIWYDGVDQDCAGLMMEMGRNQTNMVGRL